MFYQRCHFLRAALVGAAACAAITVQGQPAVTRIFTIQGSGAASPLVGQSVTTQGVVTGVFPGLHGYFLQDETGDGNPATSDAIFIYANRSRVSVTVGQRIQVTGTVTEFVHSVGAPTVTQLTKPSDTVVLGAGRIAPTVITLPVSGAGNLARFESMLVRIDGVLTVSQNYFLGRYGQVTLSSQGRLVHPTEVHRPGTPGALALAADNARRRIVLDDGQAAKGHSSGAENPNPIPYLGAGNTLRGGDTVAGLTGIIDFGRITQATGVAALLDYRLQPTIAPVFVRANARSNAPLPVGGTLKVASFNVLNFFTTFTDGTTTGGASGQGCLPSKTIEDCRGADSPAEFARQRGKILAALLAIDADVVGLMEVQRNGTGTGSVAVQNIVDGLNTALGAGTYAVVPDPANGAGTDAIRVGMIYKPKRVGRVADSLSDNRRVHSRPPLAQTFQAPGGERFSVIVTHFKAKRCDFAAGVDADRGDGQGCFNERRKRQAGALLEFIASVQTVSADPDVLVIGDLNSYSQEDPLDILLKGGLSSQSLRFAATPAQHYSYVFNGEAGTLDHGLATASMAVQVSGATDWHINADEPAVLDYNVEFKSQDLYAATPYRASDHDPVIIGLRLGKAQPGAPKRPL